MNYTSTTPIHRKHSNVQCNCHLCKRFDYADTVVAPQQEQLPRFGVVELIRAIDSETWERHDYYMLSSRKPGPYNKYQL